MSMEYTVSLTMEYYSKYTDGLRQSTSDVLGTWTTVCRYQAQSVSASLVFLTVCYCILPTTHSLAKLKTRVQIQATPSLPCLLQVICQFTTDLQTVKFKLSSGQIKNQLIKIQISGQNSSPADVQFQKARLRETACIHIPHPLVNSVWEPSLGPQIA